MKVIVTGSLGNISQPMVQELVSKGHAVTVITSKAEKKKDIEALGAAAAGAGATGTVAAAVGSVEDAGFLATAFQGADVVYAMIPPNYWFNGQDAVAYCRLVAGNYAQAIRQTGVKRVVLLSSFGADLDKGTGFILGAHHTENILRQVPGIELRILRPTSFYTNFHGSVGLIKAAGFMASNFGRDKKLIMVSPRDIAAAAVEEIEHPAAGGTIRYIASDEMTAGEAANVLGAAIGKPGLKWITLTDAEMQSRMEVLGMRAELAAGLVELWSCFSSGKLAADFERHRPAVFGKVKLPDFAQEFAAAFK